MLEELAYPRPGHLLGVAVPMVIFVKAETDHSMGAETPGIFNVDVGFRPHPYERLDFPGVA